MIYLSLQPFKRLQKKSGGSPSCKSGRGVVASGIDFAIFGTRLASHLTNLSSADIRVPVQYLIGTQRLFKKAEGSINIKPMLFYPMDQLTPVKFSQNNVCISRSLLQVIAKVIKSLQVNRPASSRYKLPSICYII